MTSLELRMQIQIHIFKTYRRWKRCEIIGRLSKTLKVSKKTDIVLLWPK